MPRPLPADLHWIYTEPQSTERQPSVRVLVYDIRSSNGVNTMRDVVLFNRYGSAPLIPITGPLDITEYVTNVQLTEEAGDYLNSGIAASSLTVSIVDEVGLFDPSILSNLTPSSPNWSSYLARYLRAGNVITVTWGDRRVSDTLWPLVFTGEIVGQTGYTRSRVKAESFAQVRAVSREAHFMRFNQTSDVFTRIDTHVFAAEQIAQQNMGLSTDEYSFSSWGSTLFGHDSVQLVEETPITMLAKLMLPSLFKPRFDGRGVLTQQQSTTSVPPTRFYADYQLIRSIDHPWSNVTPANMVIVIGLEALMSKVTQPNQSIAETQLTTGFFTDKEDFNVFWAEDKTLVLDNASVLVHKSVNGGLTILGGGESFTLIATPGPGGGTIGVRVRIDTGFAPWLITFLLIVYITFAAYPDLVPPLGGSTIPVGRIIEATSLISALWLMSRIGRGHYEYFGDPIEYVFKEIRATAGISGVGQFDESQQTVENHLINTQAIAETVARELLFLEQARAHPRTIEMVQDLALEPDDTFEMPDGRRFLITRVTHSYTPDNDASALTTLDCHEITPGIYE